MAYQGEAPAFSLPCLWLLLCGVGSILAQELPRTACVAKRKKEEKENKTPKPNENLK